MSALNEIRIRVERCGANEIKCICDVDTAEFRYAFYVYCDGEDMAHYGYQDIPEVTYWMQQNGVYTFKVFIADAEGHKVIKESAPVPFCAVAFNADISIDSGQGRQHWYHNVAAIVQEIWNNRNRMFRVSRYSYRVLNQDAYLGNLWNIINPLIQIGTYWFVFGIGLRGGRDVDGYPYIIWMLSGLIPWFFMSQCITQGAAAIRKKGTVYLKMRYPIATMPVEAILVAAYSHLVMLGFLLALIMISGFHPSLHWLNMVYYLFFALCFFIALAMVTSVLSMIAVDVQKLIASLIRLLFYLTPILWSMETLPSWIQFILRLNPCLYVVTGFRESLLYNIPFFSHWKQTLLFWGMTFLLIVMGSNLQIKYRDRFIDME